MTTTEEPPAVDTKTPLPTTYREIPLIYGRIAACVGEIEAVGKDHKNTQQGYSFRAIDDFFDRLQPVLAKYRVFVTPMILSHTREERTTKNGGVMMTTLTHVRFRVWTEDGSFIEADALGEGADSGDKSANKSASQALKYLFMQVFCVRVSGEKNDTENDSPAYTPKPNSAPKAPQTNQRAYTVSNDRTYQKPAPQASQERPAATPAAVLPAKATPKTQEWAWNGLVSEFGPDVTWNFLVSKKWVNPESNDYSTWTMEAVPTSKQALAVLADEIRKTLPNDSPPNSQPVVDSDGAQDSEGMPAEIANVVISVPRKGQRRADYMAAPDTILSLWKGSQDDRKRLFGLKDHYNPEPWIGSDGKKRPPSQKDLDCRTGLDAFGDWVANRKEPAQ